MRWVQLVTGQRWVRADQVVEVKVSTEREKPAVLVQTNPPIGLGSALVFAEFPRGTEAQDLVRCAEMFVDELVLEDPSQPVVPAIITAEDCGG